jgi:small subunit ribosomal protein S8
MVNDIISDSLTRIRNASMRRLDVTTLLYAKIVESILVILQAKGYIENFNVVEKENNKKFIKVILKYDQTGYSVINELTRVSKPGRRIYKGSNELKSFKNGYGSLIVSTSQGVLANDDAFKAKVGGEVLCSVW